MGRDKWEWIRRKGQGWDGEEGRGSDGRGSEKVRSWKG